MQVMRVRIGKNDLTFAFLLLFCAAGTVVFTTAEAGTLNKIVFAVLTFLLLAYSAWELRGCYSRHRRDMFIVPPVLAALITFIISFGLTNFTFFGPYEDSLYDGTLGADPFYWLNMAMLGILIGAFAMWRGYHSPFGKRIGYKVRIALHRRGLIRQTFRLHWPMLIAFIAVSVLMRVFQTQLGMFGYNAEIERLHALAAYKQYLDLGAEVGRLALVALALAYFSARKWKPPGVKLAFAAVLLMEVTFGFLSGFKGQAVMPLVIVGLCYYITKRRLPLAWIGAALIMLLLAYQVVEPFRVIRNQDPNFHNRSIVEIAQIMGDIALDGRLASYEPWMEAMAQRMGFTSFAARSIAYKEEVGLDADDPHFVQRTLMAPFFAYIPRLIWPSKPTSNLGWWYNVRVIGRPETTKTSTAMSPVGYLYFAGGMVGVFIGFFVIGMAQRLIYEAFAKAGGGGWIVFLGLLSPLVVIDSDVGGIFTSLLRYAPLLIVGQYLILRRGGGEANVTMGSKVSG